MARALSRADDELNASGWSTSAACAIIASTITAKRHLTTGSKAVRSVGRHAGLQAARAGGRHPSGDGEALGRQADAAQFRASSIWTLSQGAVDGEENPLPTIQSGKLFEVQKYLVLTGHVITPRLVIVNDGRLAEDSRVRPRRRAGGDPRRASWNDARSCARSDPRRHLQAGGMIVIEPDVERFRQPVLAKLPPMFEAKWARVWWERLQAL